MTSNSHDHVLTLELNDRSEVTLPVVIEATGLFLNAFVEGSVVHDRTYEFTCECESSKRLVLRANLRHPQSADSVRRETAFAPLYLVFAGWYLAGANVSVGGPWKELFPGEGALTHESTVPLKLKPLFQDELSPSQRMDYPALETLAEIHTALPFQGKWSDVKESQLFGQCFHHVTVDPKATNNVQLQHRSGLQLGLVLANGIIKSRILDSIHPGLGLRLNHLTCQSTVKTVRTWWDAWVGHCSPAALAPKHLMVLPNEVSVVTASNSIWRYRLLDKASLEKPLQVNFGSGVNPTRDIESWLRAAAKFGEGGCLDIAIACAEQALASATALKNGSPDLAIQSPLGVSIQQELDHAETEYLRWLDAKDALENPPVEHEAWHAKVISRGLSELQSRCGCRWEAALGELVEAINREHYHSEDYHQPIHNIANFFWSVQGEIGRLEYSRLFGSAFISAKVPQAALSALGYRFEGATVPVHVEFDDIFTLTLGKEKFWGSVERRALVACSEPTRVYYV